MDLEELKKQAAEKAVAHVRPDMVVGLGTGSTSFYAVNALAKRMKEERFSVVGVPTSERTAAQAKQLGIPLATLEEKPRLDLAIDGADEVQRGTLHLIKGAGGALLREKLVEAAAAIFIVIADETKKVERLGTKFKLPVEIVRFGWKSTFARVEALGCKAFLRPGKDGQPFVTDENHYLLDCQFPPIENPAQLADRLKETTGVVEHGLFIGMTAEAIIAGSQGIEVWKPS